MPNIRVFVFLNMQVWIYKKRTKNHEKTTKRARELEKSQKPKPGKEKVKVKAQKVEFNPGDSCFATFSPWKHKWKNYTKGPSSLKNLQIWSFED